MDPEFKQEIMGILVRKIGRFILGIFVIENEKFDPNLK